MKLMTFVAGAAVIVLAGCPASGSGTVVVGGGTTPPPNHPVVVTPPPVHATWDSSGWDLLGTQTVDGHADHDTVKVGTKEGRYSALTMVVTDSDLLLDGFIVKFGDNTSWDAKTTHQFREGQRTRAIDLPGEKRYIKQIDLLYRNIPGGGKAKVEIWGKAEYAGQVGDGHQDEPNPPPPPPTTGPSWDPTGWSKIGTSSVDGKVDKDTIKIGKKAGKFDKLTIVVSDSDLDLVDFVVTFGDGSTFAPKTKYEFREGTRSRVIDLPGKLRYINKIDVAYANLPGGGKAKLEVWARDTHQK